MKVLWVLLFLVSCNDAIKGLTPEQQAEVKKYMASQPQPQAEPAAISNTQRLEVKVKNQENYSKTYEMNCTNDLVTDPSSVAIYRCENQEVICYSEHRGGMNCIFK